MVNQINHLFEIYLKMNKVHNDLQFLEIVLMCRLPKIDLWNMTHHNEQNTRWFAVSENFLLRNY